MKLKNMIAVLLIALTLGMLFTGCGKDAGDESSLVGSDSGQDDGSEQEDIDSSMSDDEEVDKVIEDNLDDDIEIGSLI